MRRTSTTMALAVGLLLTALAATHAGERRPGDGKALSEIIRSVEDQKLGVITEVEYDDGYWEVEVHKDGKKFRLRVHPESGGKRAK